MVDAGDRKTAPADPQGGARAEVELAGQEVADHRLAARDALSGGEHQLPTCEATRIEPEHDCPRRAVYHVDEQLDRRRL